MENQKSLERLLYENGDIEMKAFLNRHVQERPKINATIDEVMKILINSGMSAMQINGCLQYLRVRLTEHRYQEIH